MQNSNFRFYIFNYTWMQYECNSPPLLSRVGWRKPPGDFSCFPRGKLGIQGKTGGYRGKLVDIGGNWWILGVTGGYWGKP